MCYTRQVDGVARRDELLAVRRVLESALPAEPLYGFTPEAGLPLGFRPAASAGVTA